MDAERVDVARCFSVSPMSLLDWLRETYNAEGDTLRKCIGSIDAYDGVGSPTCLQHRYVLEDVPTGLVPISYFGKLSGVKTPAIDAVVNMACQLYEIDFWRTGRNPRCMGLNGMTIPEIIEYVQTGARSVEYARFHEPWSTHRVEVEK
jgi:opine dehydrogenase